MGSTETTWKGKLRGINVHLRKEARLPVSKPALPLTEPEKETANPKRSRKEVINITVETNEIESRKMFQIMKKILEFIV